MNIQYYGHSCFKITTKPEGRGQAEVIIFTDPFDRSVGLRPPQGQANIVLISHRHFDHSNTESLKGDFSTIDIPGEYSLSGVNIVGVDSYHDKDKGADLGHNTIYLMESEGIRLCHLGDLGCSLDSGQLDAINGVDILMIPIGGKYTIDGKEAAELVRKIEPKIVIPMHYKIPGSAVDIEDEKKFCMAMGNCPREKVNKINIKSKELEADGTKVILMSIL